MKVCLIIITYNSNEALFSYLNSLKKFEGIDIVVVDNYEKTDLSKDLFDKRTEYLKPNANLGYSGGFKHGFDHLNKEYDLYIQSNADILIDDKDFFKRINNIIEDDSVGVFCPRIISLPNKVDQNPYLRTKPSYFWKVKYFFINYFQFFFNANIFLNKFIKKSKKRIPVNKGITKIFAPHGSFICYTKHFFRKLKTFETRNFLYYEEEILGFICGSHHLKVLFDSESVIYHKEHFSTSSINLNQKRRIKFRSFKILIDNYFF